MQRALDSANEKVPSWSDRAFAFLLEFITRNDEFLAEDVRNEAKGIVPDPPSKRAWGGVIVRAKKEGYIVSIGFKQVSNPKAHRTPATLWKTKNR